ncbi:MAG: DHH family phosphoesterase [Hadesarchaea archaeon]|nr:DHH family phosphoesterase [Hadesarchaea archaeon]
MEKLARYLKKVAKDGRRVLVLSHPHADLDALGCLLALEDTLGQIGARVSAGVPESLDRLSKNVLGKLGRRVKIDPTLDAEVVVLVDTSSIDQLGDLSEEIRRKGVDLVVIDHHRSSKETLQLAKHHYVDEGAASAVELVLKLLRKLGGKLNSKTALVMLAGIITDTGQFKFANDETFRAVNELLEAGASYHKALQLVEMPEDRSKRVAMLKAAQRAELYRAHKKWILFSELGAFEADAASMFVKIGADVAVVGSEEKGEVRISARARSGVAAQTELHLGELMENLAKEFGGTGGGHAGAAAAVVNGKLEDVKEFALKALNKMLRPKKE